MKKTTKAILATFLALGISGAAFADHNQPPPEHCYGYQLFGMCLTYEK